MGFDYPVYPGHAEGAPYDLKHQLVLMTRTMLFGMLSMVTWFTEPLLRSLNSYIVSGTSSGLDVSGVRLIPSKVVARPGRLSQGEYLALAHPLMQCFLEESRAGRAKVDNRMISFAGLISIVVQCQLQAQICPELFDYTGLGRL